MRKLVLALLLGILIGWCLSPSGVWAQAIERKHTSGGGGSQIVSIDGDGWIAVQGHPFPFKFTKTTLADGRAEYAVVVQDNGQEKTIAFADY